MIDYTNDIVVREQQIKRTLTWFAIAVAAVAMVWLGFTRYV